MPARPRPQRQSRARPSNGKPPPTFEPSQSKTFPVILTRVVRSSAGDFRLSFDLPETYRSDAAQLWERVGQAMHVTIVRGA